MARNTDLQVPMKAQDVREFVNWAAPDPFEGISRMLTPEYAMELKYDGSRNLLELGEEHNTVWSHGRDVSDNLPHLRDAIVPGAAGVLLDGELLAKGPNGQLLSAATAILTALPRNAIQQQDTFGKAQLMVFDILTSQRRNPVTSMSYHDRRTLLGILAEPLARASGGHISVVESLSATRETIMKLRDAGEEGVMIKALKSSYIEASRSGGWYKLKFMADPADAFITGWTEGKGSNTGLVGSVTLSVLHLAADDAPNVHVFKMPDDQVYLVRDVAKVGGFTQDFRQRLSMPDNTGLRPEWYGHVMSFTCQGIGTGGWARHPILVAEERADKGLKDCGPEQIEAMRRVL